MPGAEIIWVGHAGFVLRQGAVSLLVDPWLTGRAFDDGWDQYGRPRLDDDVRDATTHIWFSHEHPDHFSPASLRSIPPDVRRRITVLYQAGSDGRVLAFCAALGFGATQSMPAGRWMALGDGVEARCTPHWLGDSYLAVRTDAGVVVNLNDCVIDTARSARAVAAELDEPPAVLLTQFSYASRVGNPRDGAARRAAAARVLDRVQVQAETLRPRFVVPFASFVWFCHEENGYMNDGVNRVSAAVAAISERTAATPVVLRPGTTWCLSEPPPPPELPARLYDADLDQVLAAAERVATKPVGLAALVSAGEGFAADLVSANGSLVVKALTASGYLRPILVELVDLGAFVSLSAGGIVVVDHPPGEPEVRMTAAALLYLLSHRFGGSSLLINARYEEGPRRAAGFYRLVRLRDANNEGRAVPSLAVRWLARRADRRLPPGSAPARWVRRWGTGSSTGSMLGRSLRRRPPPAPPSPATVGPGTASPGRPTP